MTRASSDAPAGTTADRTVKVGAEVCVCTDRDRLTCGRVEQVRQILAETVTVETSTLQVLQAARAEVRLLSDFGQRLKHTATADVIAVRLGRRPLAG